jgi:hypothetical protein
VKCKMERLAPERGWPCMERKVGKESSGHCSARKLGILLDRLWVTGEVYEPLRNTNMQSSRKRLTA